MTEDRQLISRRTALKGSAIASGIGIVGGGALMYRTEPVAAVDGSDLTFDDIVANVDDGEVETVELDFSAVEIVYEGFDDGIDEVDIDIEAVNPDDDDADSQTILDENVDEGFGEPSDEVPLDDTELGDDELLIDITEEAGSNAGLSDEDFSVDEGEDEEETDVEITITATINSSGGDVETSEEVTGTVTIQLSESAAIGGEITKSSIE